MRKNEFYIEHKKSGQRLHCIEWLPDGECVAVLQIVHGMIEHAGRYENTAEYFCCRGIAVVAHDHPGHGLTVQNSDDLGHIPRNRGSELLVECAYEVTKYIIGDDKYRGLPRFILGHSMGSFVTRRYLTQYSEGLWGAVIMGTANQNLATLAAAKTITKLVGAFRGERHRSKLITVAAFGSYNKRFPKEEGISAWVTSDRDMLAAHDKDPLASFMFTVAGYEALFDTLWYLAKEKNIDNIPKSLPILFMAGTEDPVGQYGKGPSEVAKRYRDLGIKDVCLRMYEGDRHEVLNETDREKVCEDLYVWLKAHMAK